MKKTVIPIGRILGGLVLVNVFPVGGAMIDIDPKMSWWETFKQIWIVQLGVAGFIIGFILLVIIAMYTFTGKIK